MSNYVKVKYYLPDRIEPEYDLWGERVWDKDEWEEYVAGIKTSDASNWPMFFPINGDSSEVYVRTAENYLHDFSIEEISDADAEVLKKHYPTGIGFFPVVELDDLEYVSVQE